MSVVSSAVNGVRYMSILFIYNRETLPSTGVLFVSKGSFCQSELLTYFHTEVNGMFFLSIYKNIGFLVSQRKPGQMYKNCFILTAENHLN